MQNKISNKYFEKNKKTIYKSNKLDLEYCISIILHSTILKCLEIIVR